MQFTSSINWITFQQDKRSTKAYLYSLSEGCNSNHIIHSPSLGSLAVPIRFVRYHNIQMFLDSSADILSMCRLNINGWQVKKCSNQSWVWSIFNTDRVLYFFSLHDFFFFFRMHEKNSKSCLAGVFLVEGKGREHLVSSLCTVSLYSEKNSNSGTPKFPVLFQKAHYAQVELLSEQLNLYWPFQFPF